MKFEYGYLCRGRVAQVFVGVEGEDPESFGNISLTVEAPRWGGEEFSITYVWPESPLDCGIHTADYYAMCLAELVRFSRYKTLGQLFCLIEQRYKVQEAGKKKSKLRAKRRKKK